MDRNRSEALDRCSEQLAREGFAVTRVAAASSGEGPHPDLVAERGQRLVRVLVFLEGEIDAIETPAKVGSSLQEGETRVCVPWPFKWGALSNLERWDLRGASVMGW